MTLPPGGYQPARVSYLDAGNEIGTASFYGPSLNAANYVAKTALWAALLTAMDALCLGNRVKDVYNDESLYNVSQPTNGAARELKLLVQYKDAVTGAKFTTTVPTLDPAIPEYVVNVNARDVVLLDGPTAITDFITAFNAFAVNPVTGNAVTVVGLKVVGRSI